MKAQRSMMIFSGILAGMLIASAGPSFAQQKTAKQCDAEWQANKAAIQASGKTKKDYVATCRQSARAAAAQPSPRAATSATAPKSQPTGNAKASPRDTRTAAQAQSPAPPAGKASPRDTRTATQAQSPAPPASKASPRDTRTATQARATRPQPNATATTRTQSSERTSPRTVGNASAAQYSSVVAAKAHCPLDTVVWVNTDSKIYHYSDSARYGKTKDGVYMCEKETAAAGFRAAKNEKDR
jgi:hypothetical protein